MFGNTKEIEELRESYANMCTMVEELKSQSAFLKSKICSLTSQIAAMTERVESLEALLAQKSAKPASAAETIVAQQSEAPSATVLYLSAPAADGTFTGSSPVAQEGSSVYCLTTADGYNGSFSFIDNNDALATAMISVSQFVKSVCKVEGNTRQYPTRIVTVEQGSAVREGDVWKVSKKALVRFEI